MRGCEWQMRAFEELRGGLMGLVVKAEAGYLSGLLPASVMKF